MGRDEILRALTEDHRDLIAKNPRGASEKFDRLATSAFAFFRGTSGLFFRALEGTDRELPDVLCNGDAHPENFGVQQAPDGKLAFGLNDFDEAAPAPFTWDLKRAAVGFELASRERGFSLQQRARISGELARGYIEALQEFKGADSEHSRRQTVKDDPKLIRRLIEEAGENDRPRFLRKRVDLDSGRFLRTEEIHPVPERRAEFQKALDGYRKGLDSEAPGDKGFFRVKDVAIKTGSGTDSIGLERYWVLVEGPSKKPEDDLILEVREVNASALAPYARVGAKAAVSEAERIARAQRVQRLGGDRFYGTARLHDEPTGQEKSYLVRERSPYKETLDWRKLDAPEMARYARVAGALLAQAHVRSDRVQAGASGSTEGRILNAIDAESFPSRLAADAETLADRLMREYRSFLELHAQGRFRFASAS
jgi:uncharacterized protein (DUF2252 family)